MADKKHGLVIDEIFSKDVLDKNKKTLEGYKKISSITKKIDLAMGRKKEYKYSSGSTKHFKINNDVIPPTTKSYKV